MTREEYNLVYSAFRSYRVYMTDAEEVLSEKILDDLFYPEFDKLKGIDLPTSSEVTVMIDLELTYDEAYQFIKLYDILRDMDMPLTEKTNECI